MTGSAWEGMKGCYLAFSGIFSSHIYGSWILSGSNYIQNQYVSNGVKGESWKRHFLNIMGWSRIQSQESAWDRS